MSGAKTTESYNRTLLLFYITQFLIVNSLFIANSICYLGEGEFFLGGGGGGGSQVPPLSPL